jgi:hypothetical protein
MRRTLEERFWAKVLIDDGCWLWTGFIAPNGYGHCQVDKRPHCVHRLSYVFAYGPIPPGMMVCHRCDVRHCVRPAHLFLGTHADNMADMVTKRRSPRGLNNSSHRFPERRPKGERHGMAKLSESDVLHIRSLFAKGLGMARVARESGVSESQVARIRDRKTWKHLP